MSDPVAVVFVVKIYQEKNKRMKENMKEYRSQHEEKVRKEGEKMMLDWLKLKKLWKKKKMQQEMSSEDKDAKAQWCKYTVLIRRTCQLLDLADKKVH